MREFATIARDAAVLSLGSVLGAAVSFLVWVYLARSLPAEDYGALGAAFAFVALFHLFGDFGVHYVAIREGAKDPARATTVLRDLLGLKLVFLAAATVVCLALAVALPFHTSERALIFLYMATLPITGIASYVAGLFNVHRRMTRLATIQLGERAAYAALVPATIALGLGAAGAVLAAIASATLYAGLAVAATRTLRTGRIWPPSDRSAWRPHTGAALQFGAVALLATIHRRVDVILLAILSDPTSLAHYVAASQVFLLLLLIASGVAQAAFPWLVPQLHRGEVSLRRLVVWSAFLGILAVPVAASAWAGSTVFFPFLFGVDVGEGAVSFQILVWAFIPAMATIPTALALDALNLQRIHLLNAAMMAGINIVLNLAWIPTMGAPGAAWAAVAAWSYGLFGGTSIALVALRRHERRSSAVVLK